MVPSLLILTLLWGSEVWWTSAQHIVNNLNSRYLRYARRITNLLTRTRTNRLLAASIFPALQCLLDNTFRRYGHCLLSSQNSHPNKATARKSTRVPNGIGLSRIRPLLDAITPTDVKPEETKDPADYLPTAAFTIPVTTESGIKAHSEWLSTPGDDVTIKTGGSWNNTNLSG